MAMSRRYNHTMSPSFAPLQLLLMMFAGWINRHQLDVIDYLQEENRLLKESLERAVRHYMAHYHSERNHRAWKTDFRSPHPSPPYSTILFNADSASAECSATTIGPQPDQCRWFFLDNTTARCQRVTLHTARPIPRANCINIPG